MERQGKTIKTRKGPENVWILFLFLDSLDSFLWIVLEHVHCSFETKKKEIFYESLESKVWIEVDILFCVSYLTYIQPYKNYQNFHPYCFFTSIHVCVGLGVADGHR